MRPTLALAALSLLAITMPAQGPVDPTGVQGTRMICGGGKLPPEIQQRFIELSGGDEASIALVPTASETADRKSVV